MINTATTSTHLRQHSSTRTQTVPRLMLFASHVIACGRNMVITDHTSMQHYRFRSHVAEVRQHRHNFRVVVLSARPLTCLESHMALYAFCHFRSVPTVGFADFFIRAVIARKFSRGSSECDPPAAETGLVWHVPCNGQCSSKSLCIYRQIQ